MFGVLETDQGYHALDVVGQHLQRHLGADMPQAAQLEMGGPNLGLDRPEGMLECAAAQSHRIIGTAQAVAHLVHQLLVLPTAVAALRASGAA